MARSERPSRRWISTVRPFCLPALASRCVRVPVDAGSIPYSAVSQPRPEPESQRGTPSSSVAVQSTRVLPKEMSTEPWACSTKSVTRSTGRSSSGRRASRVIPPRSRHDPRATRTSCGGMLEAGGGPGWPRERSSRPSRRGQLEVSHRDVLDAADRELEEAFAEGAELLRRAGRQEAGGALVAAVVLDPLPLERLGHLAGGLLGGEDQRRRTAEHALEHAPDERVVRAAEDDGIHVRRLQRRRVLAHGVVELVVRLAGFDRSEEHTSEL